MDYLIPKIDKTDLHTFIWLQVFQSNINNVYTLISFQVTNLCNKNNHLLAHIYMVSSIPVWYIRGKSPGVVGNVLDCHIIVSEF